MVWGGLVCFGVFPRSALNIVFKNPKIKSLFRTKRRPKFKEFNLRLKLLSFYDVLSKCLGSK